MSGLTSEGFVAATMEEIRDDLESALQAAFGPSIPLGDDTILGQLVAIVAERIATLWELAEAVNTSQDPDGATGARLDALCALSGTLRLAAVASTVTLTLTGTAATAVSAGSQAATASGDVTFATDDDATITAATAWAGATAYVVGDIVTNATRIYRCITAGTSAGSGGPTTTSDDETDNTVHWRYLGEGAGYVDVEATATETGPLVAVSGDVTEIVTPVSGWSSVINVLDADTGRDVETDEDLRARREADLAAAGTAPADAIRSDVLGVDGVTSATVFVNASDTTDGDGVPPHAVEVLVQGGDDQDLWNQLFASVAAGIATYGTESGTATDSQGTAHTVKFSRPTEVDIYVDIEVDVDATEYPTDGDDQIKAAIVAGALGVGYDVRASAISRLCFDVPGVLDVTLVEIGTSPSPSASTTIVIDSRELAVFDTSRITVVSTGVTP